MLTSYVDKERVFPVGAWRDTVPWNAHKGIAKEPPERWKETKLLLLDVASAKKNPLSTSQLCLAYYFHYCSLQYPWYCITILDALDLTDSVKIILLCKGKKYGLKLYLSVTFKHNIHSTINKQNLAHLDAEVQKCKCLINPWHVMLEWSSDCWKGQEKEILSSCYPAFMRMAGAIPQSWKLSHPT